MPDRSVRRPVVFLHGAGRSGTSAWPGQQHLVAERDCRFLERLTIGDDPDAVVADLVARAKPRFTWSGTRTVAPPRC